MAELPHLQPADQTFLRPYLPASSSDPTLGSSLRERELPTSRRLKDSDLPFVTLTYASSLDSMIALAPGMRTTLSGPETKSMTHYLRLHHDAVLIGVGTAAVDDPSLNCRYPQASLADQPRPVIVDPNHRWNFQGTKICELAANGRGKGPWIVGRQTTKPTEALQSIGGDALLLSGDTPHEPMSWLSILMCLKSRGVNSVMIEGGANVINALLALTDLVDSVVITIAPTWLGQGGVIASPAPKTANGERVNSAWLQDTSWRQFGNDVVLCGRLSNG